MNKILMAMRYLDVYNCSYKAVKFEVDINFSGECIVKTWDEDHYTGNIENYKEEVKNIDQLDQYTQNKILDDLKERVDKKIKNEYLGFELY